MNSTDKFTLITNATSRAFYLLFWFFDNLYILTKLLNVGSQTIPGRTGFADFKPSSERLAAWSTLFWKISRVWWLLGIIMFMIYCVKTLRKTYTDESDLKVGAINKMTVDELRQNLKYMSKLRADYWLNFNRALYDLLICLNENELPMQILGKRINPGWEGALGMATSTIYIWSLLQFKK